MTRLLAALLAAASTVACAGPEVRGPFRNQYIDAETGKPIEGVVFLAVWYYTNVNFVDGGGESFYEAQEAVSGPDGRVAIPGLGLVHRPAVNVRFYEFVAGYDYAGNSSQIPDADANPYTDQTITRLISLKTAEERCEFANRPRLPSISDERMPALVSAVSKAREAVECKKR